MIEKCWICGKEKGQPPERCNGHYDDPSSALPTCSTREGCAALNGVGANDLLEHKSHPCDSGDGEIDHDWEWRSDWYGDPEVIGGTMDCSAWHCRVCGEVDAERDPPTLDDDVV